MTDTSIAGIQTPRARRGLDLTLLVVLLALLVASLWGAGIFDSPIQRDIRVSNVYVEDGVDLDEDAAEQIIGNRQLVAVLLDGPLEDRGGDICDDLSSIASGAVVVILGDDLRSYGCVLIAGADDENFGKAYVAEVQIASGLRELQGRPQEALKALVVNFDLLVNAGIAPQEARAIDPPLARFVVAGITLGAVALGALLVYLRGRRTAHLQADLLERRDATRGRLAERDSALAAAGVQILALDERYRQVSATDAAKRSAADRSFVRRYADALRAYTDLNEQATSHDPDDADLARQFAAAEELAEKLARM